MSMNALLTKLHVLLWASKTGQNKHTHAPLTSKTVPDGGDHVVCLSLYTWRLKRSQNNCLKVGSWTDHVHISMTSKDKFVSLLDYRLQQISSTY